MQSRQESVECLFSGVWVPASCDPVRGLVHRPREQPGQGFHRLVGDDPGCGECLQGLREVSGGGGFVQGSPFAPAEHGRRVEEQDLPHRRVGPGGQEGPAAGPEVLPEVGVLLGRGCDSLAQFLLDLGDDGPESPALLSKWW